MAESNRAESPDEAAQSSLELPVTIAKVDDRLGIVFGYAIVCKQGDEDYYDTQGDHIPERAMLDATSRFMAGDRFAKVMHEGESVGRVVFGFPLTGEIADALDILTERTGFVVGIKPDDPGLLEKYRSGELRGFSIGGTRRKESVVDE